MSQHSSPDGKSARSPRGSENRSSHASFSHVTYTMLGVQHNKEEAGTLYNKIGTLHGHTFSVPPVHHFHSKSAEAKFVQLTGSLNPVFEAERFDNLRERMQVAAKRDKDDYLRAIAMMYAEQLSNHFVASKGVDCAELERCFYPTYAPRYADAVRALCLPKPLWWRHGPFTDLENISRLPLERCNVKREAAMSFAEWFSLFWNYYQPFNTIAYLCMITAQSMVYTKELVDGLADYLCYRHSLIADTRAHKAPILFLGARTGKLGALLNQTGRLPVPVIHAHECPNTNPYLLIIPPHKQAEFKPSPIIKMKSQTALEKYEPSIVLFTDMTMNTDPTAQFRQQGSVREYVYLGLQDSYVEGQAWETWGHFKFRPKDSSISPPFVRDGFARMQLPHLSRWVLHKLDDSMQMGNGVVTTWMRRPLMPSRSMRWSWRMARLKPFF